MQTDQMFPMMKDLIYKVRLKKLGLFLYGVQDVRGNLIKMCRIVVILDVEKYKLHLLIV